MFLDSSVRSTRTIVLRPAPICSRSATMRSSTSASRDRAPQEVAVRAQRVHRDVRLVRRPAGYAVPQPAPPLAGRRERLVSSSSVAVTESVNAYAQRRVRKPSRSAPSMPRSSRAAMSSGSIRK